MTTRKLPDSWAFDFTISGYGRQRKGGFKTKNEAAIAEKKEREDLLSGARKILLADAYEQYMAATKMKDRSRDDFEGYWSRSVRDGLGHLYIEEVSTSALDKFKQGLPEGIGASTMNKRLKLVRAVLRFMWKRGNLKSVPYIPLESEPKPVIQWYDESERDRFLEGVMRLQPQWYAFFYVTARLGLRTGEVYAIAHSKIRDIPPQLVVDRAVQRGNKKKKRPAMLVFRKNDEAYTLDLPADVLSVIRWHVAQGFAGSEFLFSKTGEFPIHSDSHKRPARAVQKELGLRPLSHHKLGRHSVASQAVTAGESMKAIQAQLGHRSEASTHKYAHIGSKAQLRLVEKLTPVSLPHGNVASTANAGDAKPKIASGSN